MIPRALYRQAIPRALARNPVVALIGPRQCGKTTLARQMRPGDHLIYSDLEDPG
jgi:predicted AAA+ superfamily ATPase